MIDIFNTGMPVTLLDVLDNKEWRADQQHRLIAKYPNKIILAVKLNMPGNIKNNEKIFELFKAGWQKIMHYYVEQTILVDMLYVDRPTGPEGFIVVNDDINVVKRQAIKFETDFVAGRLFDVDVMGGNYKVRQFSRTELGFEARQCFVCNQPAKVCARSQKHDLETMKRAINALCDECFEENEYV